MLLNEVECGEVGGSPQVKCLQMRGGHTIIMFLEKVSDNITPVVTVSSPT